MFSIKILRMGLETLFIQKKAYINYILSLGGVRKGFKCHLWKTTNILPHTWGPWCDHGQFLVFSAENSPKTFSNPVKIICTKIKWKLLVGACCIPVAHPHLESFSHEKFIFWSVSCKNQLWPLSHLTFHVDHISILEFAIKA